MKPPPPDGALPKLGLKPVEPEALLEAPPKLGLNPDEVDELLVPLVAGADGVKPKLVAGTAALAGSVLDFSVVFGANRLVDDVEGVEGVEGLLPIALANMFDVAVAGGLSFGAEANG
jgi:hypothetical protein